MPCDISALRVGGGGIGLTGFTAQAWVDLNTTCMVSEVVRLLKSPDTASRAFKLKYAAYIENNHSISPRIKTLVKQAAHNNASGKKAWGQMVTYHEMMATSAQHIEGATCELLLETLTPLVTTLTTVLDADPAGGMVPIYNAVVDLLQNPLSQQLLEVYSDVDKDKGIPSGAEADSKQLTALTRQLEAEEISWVSLIPQLKTVCL